MRVIGAICSTVLTLGFTAALATGTPVTKVRTESKVDWTSAGIGGVGAGSGTINLAGVGGTVKKAFLYWHGIDSVDSGGDGVYDNETVSINGNSVTGASLGDATTNCWGAGSSRAFRADVTQFVSGNGPYLISGMAAKLGHNANGASLIVIFDDGIATNNRDLVFFEGNDSNVVDDFPGEDDGWNATLPGINYRGGQVKVQLHLADGQPFLDSTLTFTGANVHTIFDTATLYDGLSVPSAGTSRSVGFGELWDIHTFDVTAAFGPAGLQSLDVTGLTEAAGVQDCLGLVVLLMDLEPGSVSLDHFLTYKTKTSKGEAKFVARDIALVDQFEAGVFRVKKPAALANPADKNDEGINDGATHLESYTIALATTRPPQPKHERTDVKVENQFGDLLLTTLRPDRLLVPTAKDLSGPIDPPNPAAHNVDHFKCYKVKITKNAPKFPKGIRATVADQFTAAKIFDIKKPTRLCAPVDKNGEGIKNADKHLMCYKVAVLRGGPKHQKRLGIFVSNQFGPERVDTVREDELCVPSVKVLVGTSVDADPEEVDIEDEGDSDDESEVEEE